MNETIKIRCPNLLCRVILSVPREMRGECIRCANCGETLRVPSPAAAVAPAPAGVGADRAR